MVVVKTRSACQCQSVDTRRCASWFDRDDDQLPEQQPSFSISSKATELRLCDGRRRKCGAPDGIANVNWTVDGGHWQSMRFDGFYLFILALLRSSSTTIEHLELVKRMRRGEVRSRSRSLENGDESRWVGGW